MTVEEQIQELRAHIARTAARVDREMAERPKPPRPRIEDHVKGVETDTPHGKHYESGLTWDRRRRHGTMEIGSLLDLPHDLLDGISEGEISSAPPESWVFLDTETTGLAGGSGTHAFLIGVGRITPQGFVVKQFFMRDFAEEPSQLYALEQELEDARVLVTYNGKSFDIPLLESRYRMSRRRPPFGSLAHLDLLYGARRLWRLRFESCRLVELETRILGHERLDDVPGAMIPEIYFEYVRTGHAARLQPVFHHNALDIVTLACLTGIVPWAFRDPASCDLPHGAEMVSLARWLRGSGRLEQACALFRKGIERPLSDNLMFRSMWDLAEIEKKLKRHDAAAALWSDLAQCRNPHRVDALVELAKHYEHREKSFPMALEFTEAALVYAQTPELLHRRDRLRKLASAHRGVRRLDLAAAAD